MSNLFGGSIYKSEAHGWTGTIKNPRTGKRKYFYGKTKGEVKEKMQNYANTCSLLVENVATDSVEHFFAEWLAVQKTALKPRSYETKEYVVNKFIVPSLNYIQVGQITSRDIQAVIDELVKEKYSYSLIKKVYNVLHQRFNDAVTRRELPYSPVSGIQLPKSNEIPVSDIRWFEPEELQKILAEAEKTKPDGSPWFKQGYGIRFLAYTGMRVGEALALRWDDVDFDNMKIYINKNLVTTKESGVIIQNSPKTSASNRVIPMSQSAKTALLKLKEVQPEGSEFIFSTSSRKHLNQRNLSRTFEKVQQNAGIEPLGSLHSLRHTFATRLLSLGEDIKVVSKLLGHSDINITYNTYIHVIEDQQVRAIEKLDNI